VPWLEIPAHATRIVAPLALMLLDPWSQPNGLSISARRWAEWLMRYAIAATFCAHGWEAFRHHPQFIDFLISAAKSLDAYELSESAARELLSLIAVLDLAASAAIVMRRWRFVAIYMAVWGAITACSRTVEAGWPAYFEVLVRAANAGLPLTLAIYWWRALPPGSEEILATEPCDD